MPLISVIVPVYCVERYLERCVDSILRQSFTDFELILVDDGSPDGCPALCDHLAQKDGRIIVIHQANQGLSGARNTGIRRAKGEYLTFVDSDDWIGSTMLETLLSLLRQYDADISFCGFLKTSDDSVNVPDQEQEISLYSRDAFMDIILKINSNRTVHYTCGKLYKRSVMDSCHFPLHMLNEDVEGTFKAAMRSKRIVETSLQAYYYFENPSSITHSVFGTNFLCLRNVWKRVLFIARRYAPQYAAKVAYNLKRMDFTILTDSILYGTFETDRLYHKELKESRQRLRSNLKCLLAGPMVTKRKLLAWAICRLYTPIRLCFRLKSRIHALIEREKT